MLQANGAACGATGQAACSFLAKSGITFGKVCIVRIRTYTQTYSTYSVLSVHHIQVFELEYVSSYVLETHFFLTWIVITQ
jgi:hypothetical protein